VRKLRYDAGSGELEMSLSAWLTTQSQQKYSYSATFVVVLTNSSVAKFSPISTGCDGVDSCRIVRSEPAAIPNGMQYIGLATQHWDLGSHSGPLVLNMLSGHQDGLTVKPPEVDVEYVYAMHSAKLGNSKMYCEWGATLIAV
jgi:hypothetical protein